MSLTVYVYGLRTCFFWTWSKFTQLNQFWIWSRLTEFFVLLSCSHTLIRNVAFAKPFSQFQRYVRYMVFVRTHIWFAYSQYFEISNVAKRTRARILLFLENREHILHSICFNERKRMLCSNISGVIHVCVCSLGRHFVGITSTYKLYPICVSNKNLAIAQIDVILIICRSSRKINKSTRNIRFYVMSLVPRSIEFDAIDALT